jgi:transcriptional regulator with GAF, ATPase, and Fis domain
MPIALQAKLLHVLQDQEFARVGGAEVLRVDVRVLAATNRSLETAVREGRFREDLYYRLKVVTLSVPPLRQRPEEILVLAQRFLDRFNARYGRSVKLGSEARRRLTQYSWPGNVRELENMMKRVVVLQDESVLLEELQATGPEAPAVTPAEAGAPPTPARPAGIAPRPLGEVARRAAIDAQREEILSVLQHVKWNRAEAARLLQVSYKSLLYKIDLCGLSRKRGARPPR